MTKDKQIKMALKLLSAANMLSALALLCLIIWLYCIFPSGNILILTFVVDSVYLLMVSSFVLMNKNNTM